MFKFYAMKILQFQVYFLPLLKMKWTALRLIPTKIVESTLTLS